MGRWRRRGEPTPPPRSPLSGADPVGDALAAAAEAGPLVRRSRGAEPALAELPRWVEVSDSDDLPGFDTLVCVADEVHAFADPAAGLEAALGEQPGVEEVMAEDREVLYVRSRLALEDVRAAVVRAVVEVNRHPRPEPVAPEEVTDAQVYPLVDAVAPTLTAAGFVRHAEGGRRGSYFHRCGGDGFVQAVGVHRGLGELGDGTTLHDKVAVHFGVRVPEAAHPSSPLPDDLTGFAYGQCTLYDRVHVAPSAQALSRALGTTVLPWLAATVDRAALAGWATADPERIFPPMERPRHARLFAEWGHSYAARAVLRHLRACWPQLARHADAVEAKRLLRGRR
jgi:hypothetical protein